MWSPRFAPTVRVALYCLLLNLAFAEHAVALPDIEVTPLTIDFGEVEIGTSLSELITISNVTVVQDEILSIFAVQFAEGSSSDFMFFAPGVPVSLQPGEFTQVQATYTPTMSGVATAQLFIVSNDPLAGLVTVDLLGIGVAVPEPAALALLGIGLTVMGLARRRRITAAAVRIQRGQVRGNNRRCRSRHRHLVEADKHSR